jgi:hypothetical protein
MSRRSIVSLAATVMIGSACLVAISNDAAAYSSSGIPIWQPGVYRGGVYRVPGSLLSWGLLSWCGRCCRCILRAALRIWFEA